MSAFVDAAALQTESDVEQKLLYPLMSSPQALGFFPEEIRTKEYLRPLDIDKGAGKRSGYFPDYTALLSSIPVIVVEAKAPGESVDSGFREGQLYAHEVNKRYPSGLNPVVHVIACNGQDLLYGPWDSGSPVRLPLSSLSPGVNAFEDFRA